MKSRRLIPTPALVSKQELWRDRAIFEKVSFPPGADGAQVKAFGKSLQKLRKLRGQFTKLIDDGGSKWSMEPEGTQMPVTLLNIVNRHRNPRSVTRSR